MMKYIKGGFIGIVVSMCFQSSGLALTNEEVFSQFQFNFITPGARATGLGGAFIGLADDATAVESNPAGLTQLYDSEVSLEFKHIAYVTEQIFENLQYDTSITRRDFDNAVQGISFTGLSGWAAVDAPLSCSSSGPWSWTRSGRDRASPSRTTPALPGWAACCGRPS